MRRSSGRQCGPGSWRSAFVVCERLPRADRVQLGPGLAFFALETGVRIDRRELGVLGQDPELLLVLEDELAVLLVPHVEAALVLVGPLLRRVVRGMRRARRVVEEEWLVGRDGLRVADDLDRLVGDVGREVVAVLRELRLLNRVV